MKTYISIIISLLLALQTMAQDTFQHPRLTKLWETSEGLITPESVLADTETGVLYVANINEKPWEKDDNGFISKLSPDGKIIELNWATGLSAPKGMGIYKGKLYVTNIDEVVRINIENGQIESRLKNPKSVNLNDIAVGKDGRIFVSDSKGNCIFEVKGEQLTVLIESEEVKPTNGLAVEQNRLLLGQKSRIAALNLKTLNVSTFAEITGGIDGLEPVGDGSYLISDWSGKIHIVMPGEPQMLISDTSSARINAADIGFDQASKTIYVPTFFHNSVAAYQWK